MENKSVKKENEEIVDLVEKNTQKHYIGSSTMCLICIHTYEKVLVFQNTQINQINTTEIEETKQVELVIEKNEHKELQEAEQDSNEHNKDKIRVNNKSKAVEKDILGSPFKSPITPKTVSLRLGKVDCLESEIANELVSFDSVFNQQKTNLWKHKRRSSLAADELVRKRTEKENEQQPGDVYVKSAFDRLFCGISRESSAFKQNTEAKEKNGPLKLGILSDKTNSPVKQYKKNVDEQRPFVTNSSFFLSDEVLKIKESTEEQEEEQETANEAVVSKGYFKAKQSNTRENEGYETVEIKRRAVIDLFSCPSTYFRQSKRERVVHFSTDAVPSKHNTKKEPFSILAETAQEAPAFSWTGEKETITVIKRISFASDYAGEELVYKKVDKSIEFS